jgi:hypothetical protein
MAVIIVMVTMVSDTMVTTSQRSNHIISLLHLYCILLQVYTQSSLFIIKPSKINTDSYDRKKSESRNTIREVQKQKQEDDFINTTSLSLNSVYIYKYVAIT